jgi:hypothetical protein
VTRVRKIAGATARHSIDRLLGTPLHKNRACMKKRRSSIFTVDQYRLSYTISKNSRLTTEVPASAWCDALEKSACNLKDP